MIQQFLGICQENENTNGILLMMEYCLAIKRMKSYRQQQCGWTQGVMLSEKVRERQVLLCYHLYMWDIKKIN